MPFKASPQQTAVFDWITNGYGSAVVEAVAGSGKTTTLVEAIRLMHGTIFFGAYNKNIATEIQQRCEQRPGLFISTMHAAGFKALRNFVGNVQVDNNKCRNIFRAVCNKYPHYAGFEGPVLSLVSYAKQAAIGINRSENSSAEWIRLVDHFNIDCLEQDEMVIKLARKLLQESNAQAREVIDFDDMIYIPLLFKCRFFKHDWVLIDEAQDTNESRRLLALALLKPGGRLIAVGDRHQAIYGFTGADSDSLDLIANEVDATQLPLTVTYRCPKAVVAYAQNFVNHIQAHESAPEGKVSDVAAADLIKTVQLGDAILSRFNAPTVKLAYQLIAAGIAAKVEGREIGAGLVKIAKRLKAKTFDDFLTKLDAYQEREVAAFLAKEKPARAAAVEDTCGCLRVIVDRVFKANKQDSGKPADVIAAEVDAIFGDTNGDASKVVLLSSIHKAKGREWNRVFWLQTGSSKWARQPWELEQETNLCYVAATRAKEELFLLEYVQ